MAKSTAADGGDEATSAFNEYYRELFPDRWPALRDALLRDGVYEELTDGLLKPYYLDPASAAAARLLPVPGDGVASGDGTVLDACAAPGGKSVILARRMGPHARLVANERSARRRARLHRVLDDHLPPDVRSRVTVTGHDATRWGLYERDAYHAILLDVPCSSERHVIRSEASLAEWSPKRSRRLAIQAFAMLAAMIDAARAGGHILYATCALTPQENDEVIEKALDRRGDRLEVIPATLPSGETTQFGTQVLPDRAGGAGPLYACLLRKRSAPGGAH